MQTLNRLKSERPRRKYDFYETPIELAKSSLKLFNDEFGSRNVYDAMDVGAGHGIWGQAFREVFGDLPALWGIEINKEISSTDNYTLWESEDFLNYEWDDNEYFGSALDLVFGNPPYSLAEEFICHSFDFLAVGGYIFFLLRLAFLESKKRHFGLYSEYPPVKVYVLSRRPSFFSSNGKTKTTDALSYAMFLWKKGWKGKTELDWLYWEYEK